MHCAPVLASSVKKYSCGRVSGVHRHVLVRTNWTVLRSCIHCNTEDSISHAVTNHRDDEIPPRKPSAVDDDMDDI